MTSRRPLIPAVLAASVALAPAAAAQVPPPTLQWDRQCYTEAQPMTFTGTGYTPGGPVDVLFSRPDATLAAGETTADASGAITGTVVAAADALLGERELRAERSVSARDRTRVEQGADPATQSAVASFTFTRWLGGSPGRLVTGRKTWALAYGWAFAEGKPAYFLFRKGARTVASVRLGVLAGPCGDVMKDFTVPRTLRPGAYKVVVGTDVTSPGTRYTWRKVRVTRGKSSPQPRRAIARAVDAGSTRMHRVG